MSNRFGGLNLVITNDKYVFPSDFLAGHFKLYFNTFRLLGSLSSGLAS